MGRPSRHRHALPHAPRLSEPVVVVLDGVFFLLGAIAAGWLAVLTVRQMVLGGISDWWLVLVLWVVLAYLLLPRIHTMLTIIYVPDYFIGRTRTYEGLLGDPVNVAFLGSEEQIHTAMSRAGWQLADELGFRSGLRIVTSTLTRRTYPTAPVSPLFLFGRMQAFTYQQEVEGSPARRHHVRFWRTPEGWFLPGGAAVDWLAAGTYDRRVGLSIFTLQITHKIAGDTDQERDHIVGTLSAANPEAETTVIRHFSSGYHSRNGGGDAIETDGDLPVVDLRGIRVPEAAPSVPSGRLEASLGSARSLIDAVKDTASSNRIKRPMTLYFGYALILARAAVAVGTGMAGVLGVAAFSAPEQSWWLDLPGSPERLSVLLPGMLLAALIYVLLGHFTFTGHPAARLVALTLSVVGIAIGLSSGPPAPSGLAFQLWVLNLVLDIGILLTLSAGDVRDFHLHSTAHRELVEERGASRS
ncbi:LssY C-terminal domain-containing protein [Naasia sp. SYSU D00948]|uniref:LssY C-terminal domain-containing protein n=1 Tax=Naasia sp. SYSU D00948 TaxID=2817379 RepID=UPI001B3177C0|nr:LssY C-terminal domain-containing protein [Naasia sp. SYSU D00948]